MTAIATPPQTPAPSQTRSRREDPSPARRPRRTSLGRILAWAALVVLLLVTLFPFYWMLLKTR